MSSDDRKKKPTRAQRIQSILSFLLTAWIALLLLLYLTVGDTVPVGEYLTIWPPVLWLVPMAAVAVPLLLRRSVRQNAPLVCSIILFAILLLDWRPLLRFGWQDRHPGSMRFITWNIGGGYEGKQQLLAELEQWEPDIVLLQETPDGTGTFQPEDLQGYWEGWHWVDSGDCGTLSRWPLRVLETEAVGPWDKPQVLVADCAGSRSVLLVNVRLMLPSLELLPFDSSSRQRLASSNRRRVAQYPALHRLIEERLAEGEYDGVILGGDFNTDSSARSLAPLKRLSDPWQQVGRGWGGTVTNSFPAARIDLFLVDRGIKPIQSKVPSTTLSDHKPVVADVDFRPRRPKK
jgi:endonuclease/exonuclease/phosphatase (EEP) superfamily protein YafD